MNYDEEKVTDATLALMYLGAFEDAPGHRTWKGFDWAVLRRLHERGYISNPANKNKSVWFTDGGFERSRTLSEQLLGVD